MSAYLTDAVEASIAAIVFGRLTALFSGTNRIAWETQHAPIAIAPLPNTQKSEC
jgi:hypothetical protein